MTAEVKSAIAQPLTNKAASLIELAQDFKLKGFISELSQQFENPSLYRDLSFEDRLKRCFDAQKACRDTARFNSLFKASMIKTKVYISQIEPDEKKGLFTEDLIVLSEQKFIEKCTNIIITGPTGTGKTCLASACAIAAMKNGYSVRFYRINDLIALLDTKDQLQFQRFKESMRKIRLLCIDDYGTVLLNDNVVNRINEIVDCRYNSGATIITTQLKRDSLDLAINDNCPIKDALLDRLFNDNSRTITLYGGSWRGSTKEIRGSNV